ncbi:MAG: hypothetical protein Q7K42_06270 [Candidatus Diapherotrites archaeon]|nr:hypothetical protein [Candidatus Diapherotrites archaeon]
MANTKKLSKKRIALLKRLEKILLTEKSYPLEFVEKRIKKSTKNK